jgi:pyruvate kinase
MPTDIAAVYDEVAALIEEIRRESDVSMRDWQAKIERAAFKPGAGNLAAYLALRHHDLRPLQRRLMALGLSSLGRLESRVLPTLLAVRAALAAMIGRTADPIQPASTFFAGERKLAAQARAIFGAPGSRSPVALLVTCPTEAAEDPEFMLELAKRRVEAIRINCAHDDAAAWARMIGHARAAAASTGHRMKVFMDLAGPKIRTGEVRMAGKANRVRHGDLIAIVKPGGLDPVAAAAAPFAVECALPEALAAAVLGDRVFIDDGKIAAEIERAEAWGVVARVTRVRERGVRLKPERALNFPDTAVQVGALTGHDRKDLEFVAAHADAIEFSFVQTAEDVAALQAALAALRPDDWRTLGLVLKIETAQAVANLPEIIVQAAGRQPAAVMIARGDLSVEIGFARTAEIQEEILWLAEAAGVPAIWATQVLETLVKTGLPSRGEMTDAAMAARAECVMLNKGPYLLEAIDQLQALLRRMDANQHKKAPLLRRLRSW